MKGDNMQQINEQYVCPFCGYMGRPIDFRLYIKDGISKNKFKCPDCENVVLNSTLKREMSVRSWAYWMYVCIRVFKNPFKKESDFYHRINWAKLLQNLKDNNMSLVFWDAWNDIKERYSYLTEKEVDDILKVGYKIKHITPILGNFIHSKCSRCGKEDVGLVLIFDYDKMMMVEACLECREEVRKNE